MISHQLGPTAFWALFSHSARGHPTLHGWWAPIAQHYKGKVGGRGSQYEVHRAASHPTDILTLDPILRRGAASDGKHHQRRQRHPDAHVAAEDATASTPSPPNVAAGAQMASVNENPAGASTTTAFDGLQPTTPFLSVSL